MVFLDIVLMAFFIDRIFGEFSFIKHPVIFMGDFISWFEKKFYQNSVLRGSLLTLSLLFLVFTVTSIIEVLITNHILLSIIASTGIASRMLYDSVYNVIYSTNTRESISMLVSRDTQDMTLNDVNKACIETYAENLSDGVVAPLFYLLFFGISGLFIYKAVNTLDSMVGYRNEKYEKFGKFSAILDDVLNYIPAKITAFLITIFFWDYKAFIDSFKYGKLHDSPNAGYPIAAMASILDVKLGGPTSYFGKVKDKPYFGDGREEIHRSDVLKAISLRNRFDLMMLLIVAVGVII
ncbi:cobalamin biosynthesis protein CobD [Arcobacter sp. HD9-500m-PIT-SAG03]|nr:cobalamin biosynthesis protein CobD [Arcobacter sp. HD9-500m-PIT-SAG03]